MKQFGIKIALFGISLVCCILLLTFVNKTIIEIKAPFKLKPKEHILILGDSHTAFAFNDSMMLNTRNFSSAADSYFYSYKKLKEITNNNNNNNQIDTLLLSFSSHNINADIEQRWLLNNNHLEDRLKTYFPLLDFNDQKFLLKHKPIQLFKGSFSQLLLSYELIKKGSATYGGYKNLNHNILEDELNKINIDLKKNSTFKMAMIEKVYLEKIITYSKQNNIYLIFVNPPIHKAVNKDQKKLYYLYEKYFNKVPFYDMSKLDMSDDCFGDLVHLSPKGAKQFTTWFERNNILNKKKAIEHNILYKQTY